MSDDNRLTDSDPTPPHGIERPTGPRFPEIECQLTGRDGNAFAIIASVERALRSGRVDRDVIAEFRTEATSGDYDHLLRTAMRWVTVL